MKLLILTAGFGDGHNAAAYGLRDALARVAPEASVTVFDAFDHTYGPLNSLMKRAYQAVVRYAPGLWARMFSSWDKPSFCRRQIDSLASLRRCLSRLLQEQRPEVVLSTYPVYSHVIHRLFRSNRGDASQAAPRYPFSLVTVVTDSISVCSAWYTAPSDLFIVPNEPTANVLLAAGIPNQQIQALGFPVSPLFAEMPASTPPLPDPDQRFKILFVINTGKAMTGGALEQLLQWPQVTLTITTGRNHTLKTKLAERLGSYRDRVRLLGWTDRMPELLMSHHLLIGKAGGAMVQEAIAAFCPMIINQVIPGQEEGNAKLVGLLGGGAVAPSQAEVPALVAKTLEQEARQWKQWRRNLQAVSRPDSALKIARLVLERQRPVILQTQPRPSQSLSRPATAPIPLQNLSTPAR